MKPTFEEVSKKCPWKQCGGYCSATVDGQGCLKYCTELNCAVWQMIQATKGASNEDK